MSRRQNPLSMTRRKKSTGGEPGALTLRLTPVRRRLVTDSLNFPNGKVHLTENDCELHLVKMNLKHASSLCSKSFTDVPSYANGTTFFTIIRGELDWFSNFPILWRCDTFSTKVLFIVDHLTPYSCDQSRQKMVRASKHESIPRNVRSDRCYQSLLLKDWKKHAL